MRKQNAHTWYTQLLISLATSLPDSVVHPWINDKMTGRFWENFYPWWMFSLFRFLRGPPRKIRRRKPSSWWLRHQSEISTHVLWNWVHLPLVSGRNKNTLQKLQPLMNLKPNATLLVDLGRITNGYQVKCFEHPLPKWLYISTFE